MVAIIDDREDVWGRCANLIHVKPYIFFAGTSDINAPPGSHPSHSHKKHNTPSTLSHVTPPHTTSTTPPVPLQNTPSNEKSVEKIPPSISTDNVPTVDHTTPTPATMEAESSSSSNSDSDSEDSSSSTSSSVDDTVFDILDGGSQNEPSNDLTAPSGNKTATLESQPTPNEATPTTIPTDTPSITTPKETIETKIKAVPEEMDTQKPPEVNLVAPINKTRDIKDPDKFLLYLTHTLKQVHKVFYAEYDAMSSKSDDLTTPDVKEIIPKIRQSVLKGTKILFTGVIPTNMPCEKSPEWNTARAFGASIHDRFVYGLSSSNPQKAMRATTHVIVGRPGTSKLREARRIPGIKIVTPKWLWRCAEQWELVDEREFPVKFDENEQEKETKTTAKIPKIPSKKQQIEPPQKQNSREGKHPTKHSISMDTTPQNRILERHMSIDSVSDEELERMNAEVDAEIESSSASTSSDEQNTELGTLVQSMDQDDDDEETYDKFVGLGGENGRKRKHEDVSSSSDNSPGSIGLLDESVDLSENSGSDDELANLLGT